MRKQKLRKINSGLDRILAELNKAPAEKKSLIMNEVRAIDNLWSFGKALEKDSEYKKAYNEWRRVRRKLIASIKKSTSVKA